MFKNRKLEIKLVKDDNTTTSQDTVTIGLTKEDISEMTKDLLSKAVIATVVVVGSIVAINTLSSMTLMTLNHNLTKE